MAMHAFRLSVMLPPLALWACGDPPAKAAVPAAVAADADAASGAGDVLKLELGSSDTGVGPGACPGSPGCSCASAEECGTGVCADSADTANGKACAFPFGSGCGAGLVAFTATVGEGASVCVPASPKLCNPCEKDDDCKAMGASGALCIDRGAEGRFCGIACPAGTCPSGYACLDATSAAGAQAKQCRPVDGAGAKSACGCSAAAAALKLATPCQVVNAAGACAGQRACGSAGLGGCTGKVPVAEACDGADNDCNGKTDDGAPCDDGSACTVGDDCAGGKCGAGVAVVCDDKNPCTVDACVPSTGNCGYLPTTAAQTCDDGDPCTSGDACAGGACVAGPPKACAGSACEVGLCEKATGKCQFVSKADASPCDDGNACTQADTCKSAVCTGTPKVCDDKDPCTVDSCAPAGDCTAVVGSDGVACDDGQACTAGEACAGGVCQGGKFAAPCQCAKDVDCVDDGKACNGTPYCDKSGAVWACKLNPATVVVCAPSAEPCKTAQCAEPAGTCGAVALADGVTCDDGKAWTVGDTCQKGTCVPSLDTKLCKADADCVGYEDGDACNGTLFCNKATGICQANPKTVVYCPTVDDTVCRKNLCQTKSGKCVLTAIAEQKACEDGNLCTTGEACVQGVCSASAAGDTCLCKQDADCGKFEDGDACNGTLFCNLAKAKCELNPKTIVQCPSALDGPCGSNVCDKGTGLCAMKATAGKVACDADGSDCTPVDLCKSGVCVADTANVCQCQADVDCQDDGDLCNGTPYCNKATNVCQTNPATVVKCATSGDTPCSQTVCAPATGQCAKVSVAGACSDGDACTVGDVCTGGACKAGAYTCGGCLSDAECPDDSNACNGSEVCDKGQLPAKCSVKAVPQAGAACSDGDACTTGDSCASGKCAGTALDCDDVEPCTDDSCKGGGCVHAAKSATCTDGDVCTVKDFCLSKSCKSGKAQICDDGTVCTADSCDVVKGCQHAVVVATCDDGNACTVNDACTGGKCGGAAKGCDDSNGCTTDGCDAASGCTNVANTATCSDGKPCTVGDKCGGGQCLAGAVTACDDGNGCTADSCDAAKGCVNTANAVACSDGNACTLGDKCGGGACLPGAVTACDDGTTCTADSCDPVKGCVGVPANIGKPCASDSNPCTSDTCDVTGKCAHDAIGKTCGDGLCCGGETINDCLKDCSGCGDGVCDGDETVPNCAADCGFLAKRLGAACTKPGTVDTCGDSFVCVDRGAAGGDPVCVADFATWLPFGDKHLAADFTDATDYVTDTKTGLLWAKEALAAQTWAAAQGACKDKAYGGFKDWRLPVKDELRSLVDFGKQQPACSALGLSIPNDQWNYWSATPWVGGGSVWVVNFTDGHSGNGGASNFFRVRCVR